MPLTPISAQPDLIQNLKAQYDDSAFATFAGAPPPRQMPGIMPFSGLGAATSQAAKAGLYNAATKAALMAYDLKAKDGASAATLATRVANHFMVAAAPYWGGDFRPETVINDPNFALSVKAMAPLSVKRGESGGGGFKMTTTTWLIVGALAVGAGYWYFVRRKPTY